MKKSNHCALCRLIFSLVRHSWCLDDHPGLDVANIYCSFWAPGFGPPGPRLGEKERCRRLRLHVSSWPPEITTSLLSSRSPSHLSIQLLAEDAHMVSKRKYLHGRRMKDVVDIRLIRRWIKLCESKHKGSCLSARVWPNNEKLPDSLRMVDVMQMALVGAPQNCRYAALSYVWGGGGEEYWTSMANLSPRTQPAGLDVSVIPETILDAIHLVQRIGERYLWVDALCIIQDSLEDKAAQIHIMGQIFSRAVFTIFAAGGDSARSGLPGMSVGTRACRQHVEVVQGLHLAIPLPSIWEAIARSTWNTRGWTFQELLLSHRRLFFTKYQVYFECAEDGWCEDVEESRFPRLHNHPVRASVSTGLFLPGFGMNETMTLASYADVITRYSHRLLTYESDVVTAMTALLNAMTATCEPPGSNARKAFRFGMWIRYLDHSMLWQPRLHVSHTRRTVTDGEHSRWPSWAWTGWVGGVHYDDETYSMGATFPGTIHAPPAESLVTAWHIIEEDGNIVQLEVERFVSSIETSSNSYVPTKSHISDTKLEFIPPPGTLVFRTQRAHFKVLRIDDIKTMPHSIFDIIPLSPASSKRAGRIILPSSTPCSTVFEFIVVSRCGGIRRIQDLYDDLVWGPVYFGCMLHVMAVREACDPRIRERVGLGVINEGAWLKSRSEESAVLLG
ncbi:heterokaryon incompatibility protein-domain-containing protein [Scleroderma yunnanense]